MKKMAPPTTNNWLSFSLSPMEEMLRSSSSSSSSSSNSTAAPPVSSHHHYPFFLDNFFSHGWVGNREEQAAATTIPDGPIFTSFMINPPETLQLHNNSNNNNHPAPKLEDFLGDSSSTQDDSSLTHIYPDASVTAAATGAAGAYYGEGLLDLKAVDHYQHATNSGSDVDDSASNMIRQLGGGSAGFIGHSIESPGAVNQLGFGGGSGGASNALSLAVINGDAYASGNNATNNNHSQSSIEKAIVPVAQSDCNKKTTDNFGQRTSIYRGVTRHRWTGRYEAHLWDNSCRREGQARKGRQVYLGGYDKEDKAARAYDLAALKYWGPTATTNFPVSNYSKELEEMKYVSKQEFIASLRRKSSGFSRGASIYRGVTRHHQQGRWQARIGRVAGNKDLYLGTFATEEEAAEAYDIAAIKFRGMNAVTNFEMSRYDVEAIMKSALPIGGAAKRLKLSLESEEKPNMIEQQPQNSHSNNISFAPIQPIPTIPCGIPFETNTALYYQNMFHGFQPNSNFTSTDSSAVTVYPQAPEFFAWPPHQSY